MKSNLQRLSEWLYQDISVWRPGYWSAVPYLLVMRCLVAFGIWLRFQLHSDEPLPGWTYGILVGAIVVAVILHWQPPERYSRPLYRLLVGADVLVISACYWFTGNVASDFYLFYYLPLLTAAEFLTFRWIVGAFSLSTLAFASVVFAMPVRLGYMDATPFQVFSRVFLPREVFFVAISLVWALRLRRERDSRQQSIQRQRQMQCLLDCKKQVDQTFALEEVMQLLVDHAREDLAAPFSAGLLQEPAGRPGALRVARWSGRSERDSETLELCKKAMAAENPPGSAPIVVRGRWIGAIAVRGLEARDRVNSEEYLRSLAELAAMAYGRARLFDALREIGVATAIAVELNQKLESMLDELVDDMRFRYAIISLVDTYKDLIRTIRGRNVPPGWIAASEHSLDGPDILADVVRSGNVEVSDSFDPRFSYAIWDRYNHERFARVFVPIVAGKPGEERVIGTIEAGCVKERRKAILDPNIERVTRVGRESGDIIARSLPTVLLELIAARAIDLTGADSASLHVFDGDREFLVAGAGKADKDFLRDHPPSPNGIGYEAMTSGKPVVQNSLPDSKHRLIAAGVCSMAGFPLKLSDHVRGCPKNRGNISDVVGEVAEAEGGAAEVFESAVDRFGGSVGGAGPVEVGEHVGGALGEGVAERDDLGQGGGDGVGERVDQRRHQLAAAPAVGFAVGADHALVDVPGDLDFDVVVVGEQGVEPLDLVVGEQPGTGVQHAPGRVERIAGAAAVAVEVLLDAASAVVERVAGETDDVERVHHRDGVGELLGGGGLEPGEPVHRDDLDHVAPRLRAVGEPGLEHLLGTALDHVQQPGRAGAVADRGEVDDHRHELVAAAGVAPHVLVHTDRGDTVEAGRVVDQHPSALGEHGVVGGVPRHPEPLGDTSDGQVLDDDALPTPSAARAATASLAVRPPRWCLGATRARTRCSASGGS